MAQRFRGPPLTRSSFPTTRSASVSIPVADLPSHISWTDPFNQSPNCSSSSGYASPAPNDYAAMFPPPSYGPSSNRTRASSSASYMDWTYPSRSPTSGASTLPYWAGSDTSPWTTTGDDHPATSALLTMASYPLAGVPLSASTDPMSGYLFPGPKSMAQRDEEEQAFLFPEQPLQSFGMGSHTHALELYLDKYWRMFHPSFPLLHRPTFDSVAESPMLRAAMAALGAQLSPEPTAKRYSRALHDRCVKLLDTVCDPLSPAAPL